MKIVIFENAFIMFFIWWNGLNVNSSITRKLNPRQFKPASLNSDEQIKLFFPNASRHLLRGLMSNLERLKKSTGINRQSPETKKNSNPNLICPEQNVYSTRGAENERSVVLVGLCSHSPTEVNEAVRTAIFQNVMEQIILKKVFLVEVDIGRTQEFSPRYAVSKSVAHILDHFVSESWD